MGALSAAVIAIGGLVLGWITIEMACKPCLEKGRDAIDRNLNPDYDPEDDDDQNYAIRAPLNPNHPPPPHPTHDDDDDDSTSTVVKITSS